jgi:drug/metabolite transporter (DMT)-like permease
MRLRRIDVPTLLAFAAIYVLWGSTFLAIRILVANIPPLLAAGLRFFTAGVILYFVARLRRHEAPTKAQWRHIGLISLSMFVVTYGSLFWAEKSLPSGIASVLAATVPIMTVILETWIFRTQPFRMRLLAAALVGFAGVAVLTWQAGDRHGALLPCLAVLVGSTGWALGSVMSRSLQLPESRIMTSGAEMAAGGAGLLVWSLIAGETRQAISFTPVATWALIYLITAGSLLGFTAFVYLLRRMPASRVASYAYVNPVVAVLLGHYLAGEQLSWKTAIGAALVVGSVFATLQGKAETPTTESEKSEVSKVSAAQIGE